jgi:hypothetical protein
MERYLNNVDHLDARYILDYDVLKEINKKKLEEEKREKKLRKALDDLKKKNEAKLLQ